MVTPLHAFMSEVYGANPNVTIIADNAVAPSFTLSQERQESSYGLPLKPTRPNRIAAKGISFLASGLPPEMELAMRPLSEKTIDEIPNLFGLKLPFHGESTVNDSPSLFGLKLPFDEESASSFEERVVKKSPQRKSKTSSPSPYHRAKSHGRHHKRTGKVVTAAFAA